jgi:hypothetical protein
MRQNGGGGTLLIAYRDFAPRQIRRGFLTDALTGAQYESFEAAVAAANAWIAQAAITVLHLETVILPNPWAVGEDGTADAALNTTAGIAISWHQFLRVWYRTP